MLLNPWRNFLGFALAMIFGTVCAQEKIVDCRVSTSSSSAILSLDKRYVLGDIRVFYTTTGVNQVVDLVDANGNGVPDYIENIARQANVARRSFNLLGFRDPLESSRYRAASFIDINVLDMAGNGVAYDEPWRTPLHPLKEGCSIGVDVSRNLNGFPGNWSVVAHEIFHLYQYGATMFKASWFLEGVANWAERVIRTGATTTNGTVVLPSTVAQMESQVYSQSYPTEFWSRLAVLMDSSNAIFSLPAELRYATYVNGTVIIKDDYWRGMHFFSTLMAALDAEDDVVTHLRGWPPHQWAEADQKDVAHNPRILKVIQRVVRRTGVSSPEIDGFLAIP